MTKIFVSYRRADSAGHAGRLTDRLVARFGGDRVFMDVEDIAPGEDFERAIERTLDQCDHVLAIIGPQWLQHLNDRATDPDDFLRHEIQMALDRGITIIPVLVGGAKMPASRELPASLRPFGRCEAFEIEDEEFDQDAARLLDFLGAPAAAQPPWWQRLPVAWRWAAAVLVLALIGARSLGVDRLDRLGFGATHDRGLPNLTYGSWTLRNARDEEGRNWTNSVIQFSSQSETADGLSLTGRFTWRYDNQLVGTEEFGGRYIERTRQVIVQGTSVADVAHTGPERLAVGSYSAVLSADERMLLDGRWGSTAVGAPGFSGEWEAAR